MEDCDPHPLDLRFLISSITATLSNDRRLLALQTMEDRLYLFSLCYGRGFVGFSI